MSEEYHDATHQCEKKSYSHSKAHRFVITGCVLAGVSVLAFFSSGMMGGGVLATVALIFSIVGLVESKKETRSRRWSIVSVVVACILLLSSTLFMMGGHWGMMHGRWGMRNGWSMMRDDGMMYDRDGSSYRGWQHDKFGSCNWNDKK